MIETGAIGLAFVIGLACRRFDIPAPAPPRIEGALLVLAMTCGFVMTDVMLTA